MIRLLITSLLLTAFFTTGLYLENRFSLYDQLLLALDRNNVNLDHEGSNSKSENKNSSKTKEILYWVAPMDANYRRSEPGKSPMGMDLVPVYDDSENENQVTISPEVVNNIGVRTEPVMRSRFSRPIHTVGYVDYDESRISHIHIRVEGWISRLVANAEGERVKKGQLLFTLYSPTLINAQEEYLQVIARKNNRLLEASRERLSALGLTDAQIKSLENKNKPEQYLGIYAPQSGVITNLNVRDGMYLTPENNIMSIANLDTVWMQAEVFEQQVNWVRKGQAVEATLPSSPGKKWLGEVDYVYPELDSITRTLRVRLKFNNPDEFLKPNMYAYVSIINEHTEPVLNINRQALILDGDQPRVIVALGNGRFEPRLVKVGMVNDDLVEIIDGLGLGELVVTSAQFLIDSEASLKASLQRLTPIRDEKQSMTKNISIVEGTGKLNAINSETRTINISHEPISQVDWPAMTMDISVAEDINLEKIRDWHLVRFYMARDNAGMYFIRRIERVVESGVMEKGQ